MEHWARNPDRFGHLLKVAYLAGRCLGPQGMGLYPTPMGHLGEEDSWGWECLLIIADVWNTTDDKDKGDT